MTISIRSSAGLDVVESLNEAKDTIIARHMDEFQEDAGWMIARIRECRDITNLQLWVEDFICVEEVI